MLIKYNYQGETREIEIDFQHGYTRRTFRNPVNYDSWIVEDPAINQHYESQTKAR